MNPIATPAGAMPAHVLQKEHAQAGGGRGSARIGPNAITRLGEALRELQCPAAERALFQACGLGHYLAHPPESMVPESEVICLHQALRAAMDPEAQRAILVRAGELTGDYLLANRIPRAAQIVLKALPKRLATRLLTRAITAHAWTFTGSGTFAAALGPPLQFEIRGNPMCQGVMSPKPCCHYHAATFQHLFHKLVAHGAEVREIRCAATGAPACTFELMLS